MSEQRIEVERWGFIEIELNGPQDGNPFVDVVLTAKAECEGKSITVEGFYDGNGIYKIRFMPDIIGEWNYKTSSNVKILDGVIGKFLCTKKKEENHGPVRVSNQFHFSYADGTTYYPFGTTCYAWIHQPEEIQIQTLETLKKSPFNKLRMCVFPKYYHNNNTEPELYPYDGIPPEKWDFTKFNPEFFRTLENRIIALMNMGIEVDLILFHPYDTGHWGFDRMDAKSDERYLHYIIARLASFRNIWWSLANEYDYMEEKTKEDWDRNIKIVADADPYHHLLSIHQGDIMYDHWNPNITHASIQLGTLRDIVGVDFGVYKTHRDVYHKPVIYDEVGYEGNLAQRWGRLTPEELVDKFWKAIVSGAYMTHGETYTHPQDIIWWAKGGVLRGKSPDRIAFLKKIVEESGIPGFEPLDRWWILNGAGYNGKYYLFYFGYERPTEWKFELPAFKVQCEISIGTKFRVEIIDAWNMTITTVEELYEVTDKDRYNYTCCYNPKVDLPGKQFIAVRVTRVE
jgi:hypothetical protein